MSRMSRRDLMGAVLGAVAVAGVSQDQAIANVSQKTGPRYIAAYDTESPACLPACRKIVEIHQRLQMPATFFITGKTLEANAKDL